MIFPGEAGTCMSHKLLTHMHPVLNTEYQEWLLQEQRQPRAWPRTTVQLSTTHSQVESPTGIQLSVWSIATDGSLSQSKSKYGEYLRPIERSSVPEVYLDVPKMLHSLSHT